MRILPDFGIALLSQVPMVNPDVIKGHHPSFPFYWIPSYILSFDKQQGLETFAWLNVSLSFTRLIYGLLTNFLPKSLVYVVYMQFHWKLYVHSWCYHCSVQVPEVGISFFLGLLTFVGFNRSCHYDHFFFLSDPFFLFFVHLTLRNAIVALLNV